MRRICLLFALAFAIGIAIPQQHAAAQGDDWTTNSQINPPNTLPGSPAPGIANAPDFAETLSAAVARRSESVSGSEMIKGLEGINEDGEITELKPALDAIVQGLKFDRGRCDAPLNVCVFGISGTNGQGGVVTAVGVAGHNAVVIQAPNAGNLADCDVLFAMNQGNGGWGGGWTSNQADIEAEVMAGMVVMLTATFPNQMHLAFRAIPRLGLADFRMHRAGKDNTRKVRIYAIVSNHL